MGVTRCNLKTIVKDSGGLPLKVRECDLSCLDRARGAEYGAREYSVRL
jgi:hypothetical protein